jgi:hypothetical protein
VYDFGAWHFHICIGEHKGSKNKPVDPELARHRRTARAEFYRRLNPDGTVGSWGFRLFNGKDENQIYIFLPNPFLSDDMRFLKQPDWSRLARGTTCGSVTWVCRPIPETGAARRCSTVEPVLLKASIRRTATDCVGIDQRSKVA